MKIAWKALVALGILLIIAAFNYDTTVAAGGQRIHNIGLQGRAQMTLILGCALFLAGLIVLGIFKVKQTPEEDAQDRVAAEAAVQKAKDWLAERPADTHATARRAPNDCQHLTASQCVSLLRSNGYRVSAWFGRFWNVTAPDRSSLMIATSLENLHRMAAASKVAALASELQPPMRRID